MPEDIIDEDLFKDMPPKKRAEEIVEKLKAEFEIDFPNQENPFLTLVRTILSQNTNSRNTSKAFNNLFENYRLPSDLSNADLEELKKLIKPAGLYNSKSETLKEVGKIITEEYGGNLEKILRKNLEGAGNDLLELPGVGPKTADCVLLFAGEFNVLPVDTHVDRVSKRLGLAGLGENPEGVKEKVESLLPAGERGNAHILLIELGREYCKVRNPECGDCPVLELCLQIGVNSP